MRMSGALGDVWCPSKLPDGSHRAQRKFGDAGLDGEKLVFTRIGRASLDAARLDGAKLNGARRATTQFDCV